MRTTLLTILVGVLVAGGMSVAQPAGQEKTERRVKVVSAVDIVEKVGDKKTRVTTVEVTIPPNQAGAPHRHPGPVFGYVLEGEYEWAIDDNPARTLKTGDTFYEPAGCLHRVSANPSKKDRTRILAVMPHPADVKELVLPATPKK